MEKELKQLPRLATLAVLEEGRCACTLLSRRAKAEDILRVEVPVGGPLRATRRGPELPLPFFPRVMHAYLTRQGDTAVLERGGRIVRLKIWQEGPGYVPAVPALEGLGADFDLGADGRSLRAAAELPQAGPRELTPAELARPYAKYYTRYWQTPFHLRGDVRAWGEKAGLYQLYSRREAGKMLHIRDARRLLDPEYRRSSWNEGWTLFPDGTGVMCARTEFPGADSRMFQWWFTWHALEDLRYMLWFPPAHFGISPSLEYRCKLSDPALDLYEKTHGGDAVHLVYESTPIDSLSAGAAGPTAWHPIVFQDISARSFLECDRAELERQGCAALCGGTRMLHFFADRPDGSGGTLYSHFWYGAVPDGSGGWKGPGGGEDPALIQPILNIGQHAVKEFARLAEILPQLYREEGDKPVEGGLYNG